MWPSTDIEPTVSDPRWFPIEVVCSGRRNCAVAEYSEGHSWLQVQHWWDGVSVRSLCCLWELHSYCLRCFSSDGLCTACSRVRYTSWGVIMMVTNILGLSYQVDLGIMIWRDIRIRQTSWVDRGGEYRIAETCSEIAKGRNLWDGVDNLEGVSTLSYNNSMCVRSLRLPQAPCQPKIEMILSHTGPVAWSATDSQNVPEAPAFARLQGHLWRVVTATFKGGRICEMITEASTFLVTRVVSLHREICPIGTSLSRTVFESG